MAITPRERFVSTLTFGNPDRITFDPGNPRESTLANWRKQGLPSQVNWREYLHQTLKLDAPPAPPAVGLGVDFRMIPQFEEKILEHRDGHYVVQDWKGNVCEISDQFDPTYLRNPVDFVTRRWIRCPVENRDDWSAMKDRYRKDFPGRFPADFEDRCAKLAARGHVLVVDVTGPFWQMREWCGFEGLCMLMVEQPEFVDEMAAFWKDFIADMLGRVLAHVRPDMVHWSEDMAYKAHAMISPAMTRRFCMPSYECWSGLARRAKVPLVGVDSDGFIGELIPIWIESGLNECDPMEVAAHNDIGEFRREFGARMAYMGGVDKRAIAKGGAAIRNELARIDPVVRGGGYIPSCDHGVPSDISWPNFVDYCDLLARMTGWL